jgi:oligopeptide transport system ATP-binding protein
VSADELLRVRNLSLSFPARGGGGWWWKKRSMLRAVDDVSFSIGRGETLGMVGESGCGKSTTARALLRLHKATRGTILFQNVSLDTLSARRLREIRRNIQMVFQDPFSSLNPRMKVADIIAEPIDIHNLKKGRDRSQRIAELLQTVGLDATAADRFPHEFSGGQRQRIGIARALAAEPALIICDESVSALDVSIQAQIVNLLQDLQAQLGLSYLFIAHDLAVVQQIAHRVAVMYLGRIVELAPRDGLYEQAFHPYTQALLRAVPIPDPIAERARQHDELKGEPPNPIDPPAGCTFHTRCPFVRPRCGVDRPALDEVVPGRFVACHYWEETARHGRTIVPRGGPIDAVAT